MTSPTTTRGRGRPRKQPENPDCEPATKGYVKCLMRQYHEKQTVKTAEIRKQCCILDTSVWIIITLGLGCAYVFTGVEGIELLVIASGFFVINSIMEGAHLEDAARYSTKHTDFMQKYEPPCEPKRGCEEME